jgi:hypothetical protein
VQPCNFTNEGSAVSRGCASSKSVVGTLILATSLFNSMCAVPFVMFPRHEWLSSYKVQCG